VYSLAQLLDYRSSQNSNTNSGVPGSQLVLAPYTTFIGDIGLIVGSATNVRVNLWATAGLNNTGVEGTIGKVKFFIARNLEPTYVFVAGNVVYDAIEKVEPGYNNEKIVTLNATDINANPGSIAGQINYSLFAQVLNNVTILRNGPENLSGMAIG
jgi:hypothetical protein